MNFVLHHHFASRELGSGLGGVGAMLPDLWRMAHRRVVARPLPPRAGAGTSLDAILVGVAHHLDVDRWFHRTEVFLRGERRAAEQLRRVGSERSRRLPLFAHVLWEMCLDGALIRREGFASKRAELARDIAEALSTAAFVEAASLHHFDHRDDVAPDQRAQFDARVERLARQVAAGDWIEGYQDAEGLCFRLAGVRSRLGFAPPDDAERRTWRDALSPLVDEAETSIAELMADRARSLRA